MWTFCGQSVDRTPILLFHPLRADRIPVTCRVLLEGRDELEQSQEVKLAARPWTYITRRESGAVWALVRVI